MTAVSEVPVEVRLSSRQPVCMDRRADYRVEATASMTSIQLKITL